MVRLQIERRRDRLNAEIHRRFSKLCREGLNQAIRESHSTIDKIEINKQLEGIEPVESPESATLQYESPNGLRSPPALQAVDDLDERQVIQVRIELIRNLTRLCHRQETRQFNSSA